MLPAVAETGEWQLRAAPLVRQCRQWVAQRRSERRLQRFEAVIAFGPPKSGPLSSTRSAS